MQICLLTPLFLHKSSADRPRIPLGNADDSRTICGDITQVSRKGCVSSQLFPEPVTGLIRLLIVFEKWTGIEGSWNFPSYRRGGFMNSTDHAVKYCQFPTSFSGGRSLHNYGSGLLASVAFYNHRIPVWLLLRR